MQVRPPGQELPSGKWQSYCLFRFTQGEHEEHTKGLHVTEVLLIFQFAVLTKIVCREFEVFTFRVLDALFECFSTHANSHPNCPQEALE